VCKRAIYQDRLGINTRKAQRKLWRWRFFLFLSLYTGLENYGIDANALANMLKKRLGANTTVGEWKAKSGATKAEVAVSGLWEKSVRALRCSSSCLCVFLSLAASLSLPRFAPN
jgi:hypothetical protein